MLLPRYITVFRRWGILFLFQAQQSKWRSYRGGRIGPPPPKKKRNVNTLTWEIFWFIIPSTLSQPLKRIRCFFPMDTSLETSAQPLVPEKPSSFVLIRAPFRGQSWNSKRYKNRWVSYSFRLKPFAKPRHLMYGIFSYIWQNVYGKCREPHQTLSVSEGMELCLLVQGGPPSGSF